MRRRTSRSPEPPRCEADQRRSSADPRTSRQAATCGRRPASLQPDTAIRHAAPTDTYPVVTVRRRRFLSCGRRRRRRSLLFPNAWFLTSARSRCGRAAGREMCRHVEAACWVVGNDRAGSGVEASARGGWLSAHWAWVHGSWWTGCQEPGDETMPSTGLCRVDIAECMSGLVEAVDVLAGSAYS